MKASNLLIASLLVLGSSSVLANDYTLGAPTYANGKETTYYPGGQVKVVVGVTGKKHSRNGEEIAYYPSGKLLSKGEYRHNKPYGKYVQYFENGQVRLEITYNKKGKLTGPLKEYWDNGKLKMTTTYERGRARNTEEVDYYRSGEVKSHIEHDHKGQRTGTRTDYFKNGKVMQTLPYSHSSREGMRKIYNEQGQLITEVQYRHDLPVYAIEYKNGKQVAKVTDAKGLHPYWLKD
ncbi:toxin-antitoxin system YwqK family antitoxin [Gallaecimonas mangrovi]|uniref:toxin-antitoxin system YwqK family antitoxin n=1 Tax=Gallaecimonas mangrovi TaxID=2291597 RepID=UPI000E202BCE|nr:toxin-antitoxin system YwqK family antitoxin [Gallaecimonas mangrovi]